MAEKRVLVIGSANIDFVLNTPYIPAPGETLISDGSYTLVPGGKGANTAIAASKLGASVVFCTRVGNDAYGDRLMAIYREQGIDLRFVKQDKAEQTGLAVVMVEKSGANRIIAYRGANKHLGESDIESAFYCSPDAVLTQFEIGRDAVINAARNAASEKIPLFIDAGSATRGFPLASLESVEVFSPNEVETELLTGIRPNSLEDCLRASIALCNSVDIKYVVLKLGARGCYIYDGKYCDVVSPYNVAAVDTTAAGDAFTAALTVKYLQTGDIIESARYANAVGALTVTKTGALTSLPSASDVEAFITANS